MYKTRNTGTWNGTRGTREMGECYIPGNVAKHFRKRHQTFRGIFSNIPGNFAKHTGECRQTFWGMSSNILGNVAKHSGECTQTFWYIKVLDTGDHELYQSVEEPLLLNSRKRKRASLSFLRKNKNILN